MNRKERMIKKLETQYSPLVLEVIDESHQHRVPKGEQTHFKVIMVSDQFNGLSRLARHRLINQLFDKEFQLGLHALSMHLYTADEWEKSDQSVSQSPSCRDGYKNK